MVAVRAIEPADVPALVSLNNAHAVELSLVDEDKLRALLSVAALARAIGPVGSPEAFLLAFDETVPSQGPNHAWFLARHARFLYVDRVCVLPSQRRRGLARALYLDAWSVVASRGTEVLCCEVNSDPPNPTSDAFHAALGFSEVGRAFLPDRGKSVRYLERSVA